MSNKYYRVTEVLQPFSDFDHIPEKNVKRAADRGQRVHDYCSAYALGGTIIDVDIDCKPYFKSFKLWFNEYVTEVHISEQRFYSRGDMLTGKLDLYCFSQSMGGNLIIDIKTPQIYSASWQLQTAAYQRLLMVNEITPAINGRGCLMLSRKGHMAIFKPQEDFEGAWNIYQGLLNAYIFFDLSGVNRYTRQ